MCRIMNFSDSYAPESHVNSSRKQYTIFKRFEQVENQLLDQLVSYISSLPNDEDESPPACKWREVDSSYVLQQLVLEDNLNFLVLTKNPDSYSVCVSTSSGQHSESIEFTYEDNEFLLAVESGELPTFLIDLIEDNNLNLLYENCLIVQFVYSCKNSSCFTLLKPVQTKYFRDLQFNKTLSDSERLQQESEMVMSHSDPLCLTPNPNIAEVYSSHHFKRLHLNDRKIRKHLFKKSKLSKSNNRDHMSFPLLDFIQTHPTKPHALRSKSTEIAKRRGVANSSMPEYIPASSLAKMLPQPSLHIDHSLVTFKEISMETEQSTNQIYMAKMTISQRRVDGFFFGSLFVDRNFKPENYQNVSTKSCLFPLGSYEASERYIQQFRDLFTEEGLKLVKITTKFAGQPPTVEWSRSILNKDRSSNSNKKPSIISTSSYPNIISPSNHVVSPQFPNEVVGSSFVSNQIKTNNVTNQQSVSSFKRTIIKQITSESSNALKSESSHLQSDQCTNSNSLIFQRGTSNANLKSFIHHRPMCPTSSIGYDVRQKTVQTTVVSSRPTNVSLIIAPNKVAPPPNTMVFAPQSRPMVFSSRTSTAQPRVINQFLQMRARVPLSTASTQVAKQLRLPGSQYHQNIRSHTLPSNYLHIPSSPHTSSNHNL